MKSRKDMGKLVGEVRTGGVNKYFFARRLYLSARAFIVINILLCLHI